MSASKIGIAVIAMNEADRIGRLLNSVKFADEIVVVDSGSTDGTQAICKKAGANNTNIISVPLYFLHIP